MNHFMLRCYRCSKDTKEFLDTRPDSQTGRAQVKKNGPAVKRAGWQTKIKYSKNFSESIHSKCKIPRKFSATQCKSVTDFRKYLLGQVLRLFFASSEQEL